VRARFRRGARVCENVRALVRRLRRRSVASGEPWRREPSAQRRASTLRTARHEARGDCLFTKRRVTSRGSRVRAMTPATELAGRRARYFFFAVFFALALGAAATGAAAAFAFAFFVRDVFFFTGAAAFAGFVVLSAFTRRAALF